MKRLAIATIFIFAITIVFRKLLLNIGSALIDWRDTPFYVWVVNSNAEKFISLNYKGFFTTNAFYPLTNSMFFSDLLIPQGLMAIPVRLFTENPVLVFNLVLVFTVMLDLWSVYLFWKRFFESTTAVVGSVVLVFSAYFLLELAHFQMLSYWPYFFSLYFFISSIRSTSISSAIYSGFFAAVQLLASVYLGIFLLASMLIYVISLILSRKLEFGFTKFFAYTIITFSLLSMFFISGYIRTQKQYAIERTPDEFTKYSAHISDYIFPSPGTLFSSFDPIKNWNSRNRNFSGDRAAFPGVAVTLLAVSSLFVKNKSNQTDIPASEDKPAHLFFFLLLICGFVFSLGPSLINNGQITQIKLPYDILLNSFQFLGAIRALARWSFLFYLGISYFALITIDFIIHKRYSWLLVILFIIWVVEGFPYNVNVEQKDYQKGYETLRTICSNSESVLLEVPITHFDGNADLVSGLSRVTTYELSSLFHKCLLVNGYSGFDPPALIRFKNRFYAYFLSYDFNGLYQYLKKNNVSLLKINISELGPNAEESYPSFVDYVRSSKKFILLEDGLFQLSFAMQPDLN